MRALLAEVRKVFPRLIELYDNTASLQDRTVTTGIVKPELRAAVRRRRLCRPRLGPRLRCAPRRPAMRPTTSSTFEVPVLDAGDVNARVWIRIREVEQSLSLIEQILGTPARRRRSRSPSKRSGETCEGLALVEAFRGDVLVWLRLDGDGTRRALPSARSVLVPVAAAGSRDRGQHRRRLPALQQIVQLLLFGARPLGQRMRKTLFESLDARPAHRAAARARRSRARRARRRASTAPRARGSAARFRSARSMPAPATAASWKSTRSTTPSTISNASACASSPRRAMPTC